ncbi:MAG: hypothetical protein R2748_27275 [Bryobacterales bacterium]
MNIKLAALSLLAASVWAGDWTAPVAVGLGDEHAVSYRAKLDGEFLVVEATQVNGWHTYAMDNEERAKEALKGKQSLGIDAPTQITVGGGLALAGPWKQSEPHDYSKPAMRWYTWGYDAPALFAAKVKKTGAGAGEIGIRGQACDDKRCKNIDITLSVPADGFGGKATLDLSNLIAVRPGS